METRIFAETPDINGDNEATLGRWGVEWVEWGGVGWGMKAVGEEFDDGLIGCSCGADGKIVWR